MRRLAGLLMVIGPIVFISGVMTPVMMNVFGELGNPALQLEYLEADTSGWDISNAINAVGALIVAIGFVLYAWYTRTVTEDRNMRLIAYAGAVAAVLAGILWLMVSVWRIVMPPYDVIYNSDDIVWMFNPYNFLILGSMILTGFAIARLGRPKLAGWFMLVISVVMLIAFIVLGDLPPGVYYPIMLVCGVALLLAPERSAKVSELQLNTNTTS